MLDRNKVPDVLVQSSLNPVENTGTLFSPNLNSRIAEYQPYEYDYWHRYLQTVPGSIEEIRNATKLTEFYLLKTSQKIQGNPRDRKLWAERFNNYSYELYGKVDPLQVGQIALRDFAEFDNPSTDTKLIEVYKKMASLALNNETPSDLNKFEGFKTVLLEKFDPIIGVISDLPEGPYKPAYIRDVFGKIIDELSKEDIAWKDWSITNNPVNTMLNVTAEAKQIDIPDARAEVSSKSNLLGLALHELFHARRAIAGYRIKDEMLTFGLPDYLAFEEGFATFIEYICTGSKINKIGDRYVDTALVTGAIEDLFLTRPELIELDVMRSHARALSRNKKFDEINAKRLAINSSNRLFRGGDGKPVLDEFGQIEIQPVYWKDIVYYAGFVKAKKYVLDSLESGQSPESILDFILLGKFDPTNQLHLDYLKNKYNL